MLKRNIVVTFTLSFRLLFKAYTPLLRLPFPSFYFAYPLYQAMITATLYSRPAFVAVRAFIFLVVLQSVFATSAMAQMFTVSETASLISYANKYMPQNRNEQDGIGSSENASLTPLLAHTNAVASTDYTYTSTELASADGVAAVVRYRPMAVNRNAQTLANSGVDATAALYSTSSATVLRAEAKTAGTLDLHFGSLNPALAARSTAQYDHIDIERSLDGGAIFTLIARKKVRNDGEDDTANNFDYTDRHPIKGNVVYRLHKVLTDGRSEYSNLLRTQFATTTQQAAATKDTYRRGEKITITNCTDATLKGSVAKLSDSFGNLIATTIVRDGGCVFNEKVPTGTYFVFVGQQKPIVVYVVK